MSIWVRKSVRHNEVSTINGPLSRGFLIEYLTRIPSTPAKIVYYKDVSAIWDVCHGKV